MKRIRFWLALFGLGLLVTGGMTALAQDASDIPQVTIEATLDEYTMSGPIPEGVVTIIVQNNADEAIETTVMSLNEGVTHDDFTQALSQGPQEFLLLSSIKGSILAEPGASAEAILDFSPGDHLLMNETNVSMTGITPFTVADGDGDGAAPPQGDVEVGLVDFAFNVPPEITAGPQLWHVQNLSQETPHELLLARLDDDLPARAVNEILLGKRDMEGVTEIPFVVRGVSQGEQFWVTYDLEPGTYALVCFLPDIFGSGAPHAHLGMRQIILVTESE